MLPIKAFLIFVILLVAYVDSKDYCDLCDGKHTMCQLPTCPLRGKCKNIKQSPLTVQEKQAILDEHNRKRCYVARGKQKGQPKAADMKILKWDNELERIAQCWANNCEFKHDKCRDTHKAYVGQNLAKYVYFDGVNKTEVLMDSIGLFYKEVKNVTVKDIDRLKDDNFLDIGHYTQMMWADTSKIGCAISIFADDDDGIFQMILLVCNYSPGGNYIGHRVYAKGEPCSKCKSKCSRKYRGLCES